ncbi:2-amino-4-hydroxy-6- hydroxymethyldihydropteridine pyrophosphokinase [Thermincola ferriacetica]|uniref:2-amino-4-hydroxy-6-hydroxymethyldihydropteridine diphosphokinase n=2 Tax=Thermincola TaxID=278993 RepID=D5X9M9_THEPJ|nr:MULTISPECIES: 2-amino-4-hydroxy-6-hydroxymethyldihydropteridine diphosphokinase [Thermincola]ADG81100.1 2-amino-4-hydroxy-6-hydroxymethyldihydropteridine pyrophosphokinase [Thermincola potens JR]KNZ68872.1 2-amino-4-hydroxy-6- hydroxymethyldihydropteridine pyrophosphokinase [Thermincola ferriacetica]
MVRAYIALGSNQDNPREKIRTALQRMHEVDGITVRKVAPLYLTEPVGYEEQEWFYNTVAEIETALPPSELLAALQKIENHLGRVRTVRWGPRTIDLDIILYGDEKILEEDLQIPHPRFEERAFVLAPLKDLAPDMILPSGNKIGEALKRLTDKKFVCIDQKIW